ncbi:hypothetical protein PVIIG_05996 [Plasmodium vivax India VII]|uniref:Fam-l protein n=1 Tax=Plasmodium vivax India VII TaxID=1077284 RepID=A0A0J9S8V0_PLAVI|nr:hypothetical protein PVIIG_05996 [Plasmodium vivax India VII]
MAILSYYLYNENMKSFFLLKIFLFIFLLWIYVPYNNCSLNKIIEWKQKHGRNLNIRYNRLLTKRDFQKGLEHKLLKDDHPDYGKNIKIKTEKDILTYGSLKTDGLNYLDTYKKNYKKRYSKKSGLAKIDCYIENIVFDKFDKIRDVGNKWNNDKMLLKKKIKKEYGTFLILFALLPCLGLIFHILFGNEKIGRGIIKICLGTRETHRQAFDQCDGIHDLISKDTLYHISYANSVFSFLMTIIVIFFFIYILVKVIKYERLKEGKSKMRKKDYFNYCKEVFNLK